MNNLIVSYDLYQPGQDYKAIEEAIESLGEAIKIHQSVYYVRSSKSVTDARKAIHAKMDSNDTLIVIDASNNLWSGAIPRSVKRFLDIYWED